MRTARTSRSAPTPETIELAPLYDTVPTVLWPKLRTRGAMSIDDHWELATITAEKLANEAAAWPLERERARLVVAETAEGMIAAAARLDTGAPLASHISHRARALLSSTSPQRRHDSICDSQRDGTASIWAYRTGAGCHQAVTQYVPLDAARSQDDQPAGRRPSDRLPHPRRRAAGGRSDRA